MLRAIDVIAKGDWNAMPVECVVLGFEQRHRNAISLTTVSGKAVKLDLSEPVALRSGDALRLEGGDLVEVIGQPEPLAEIRAESPEKLAQIAWHMGNRHYQCQISGKHIRFRREPMLEAVVQALGGKLRFVEAAFDPEGAAYARAKSKAEKNKAEKNEANKLEASEHVHDANCGCGHDHHQHAHGAHGHDSHDHGHPAHAAAAHNHAGHDHAEHKHEHHGDCCGSHPAGHKHA